MTERNWWEEWEALVADLGPDHRLLINGPFKNGYWSVGVVKTTHPNHQLFAAVGPLDSALRTVAHNLTEFLSLTATSPYPSGGTFTLTD